MEDKPQQVIVACSSDRGLCGAIHSSICKHIKAELAGDASKAAIICVGDKSRAQLQRWVCESLSILENATTYIKNLQRFLENFQYKVIVMILVLFKKIISLLKLA